MDFLPTRNDCPCLYEKILTNNKENLLKKLVFASLLALISSQTFAKSILVITKSIREKNVIHYDVKVKDCQLTNRPISAYWILGEQQGQIQQLKTDEIPKFAPQIVRQDIDELQFTLGAFNEVDNEIVNNPILVKLVGCEAKAFIKVKGQEIELKEIHAQISILRMGVKYLLLKGKKANGDAFTYKINA